MKLLTWTTSFCSSNNFSSDVDVDDPFLDLDLDSDCSVRYLQYAWAVSWVDQNAVDGAKNRNMNTLMIYRHWKLSLDCDEMTIGHWPYMLDHDPM